jgi:hypothetical protein
MDYSERAYVDTGSRPFEPTWVKPLSGKLVVLPPVLPQSRSIPAEVGTTDPAYPVAPARAMEHPQPMTSTDGAVWVVADPIGDPTRPI